MNGPVTYRRRLLDCLPAAIGARLCVFMLALILGGLPLVEMHAHAGGERVHSHGADHLAHADDHANATADESPLLQHVHESTEVTQAMPEVDAMVLNAPALASPPFPQFAAGRGTEPPAPPRRPPIA